MEVCKWLTSCNLSKYSGSALGAAGSEALCFLSYSVVQSSHESHEQERDRRGGRMRVTAPSQQLRCDFPACSGTQW